MEYLISFIIPLYNAEKFIGRCCESLLPQCGDDIQLIFIDDASSDNGRLILEDKVKKISKHPNNVYLLCNCSNCGVAATRQKGIEAAKGKYIGFIDADDFVDDNFINSVAFKAESDYDIIGWNWTIEYKNGSKSIVQPHLANAAEGLESMLAGETRWYLWSFIVKRSIIAYNDIGFIAGANVAEDMCFLLQCFACASSYYNIGRALYHYSKENDKALTSEKIERQIQLATKNVEYIEKFLTEKYGNKVAQSIGFIKLNIKFPLLISERSEDFNLWRKTFSSANEYIWKNKRQSLRYKLLQTATAKHLDFFVKLYTRIYKIAYSIIYGK